MRVAITHPRYTATGGVERYVWDLVRRLLDVGHEVHYFCHFWDEHADPRVILHMIPNPWKQIRFMKVWSYERWLTRHVSTRDFDIVHGFSKSSSQDIYTDGSGCLRDYQKYSIDHATPSNLVRKLRRASLHQRQVLAIEKRRFTSGNFHRIITMSDLAGDQIRHCYGLNGAELITVYNGIDMQRFNPRNRRAKAAKMRGQIGLPEGAFVALCVANDYRRKGVPTLIEAARIVKQRGGLPNGRLLQIVVVGKDRRRREREFAALASDRGVGDLVRLFGPQEAIDRWHALAELFVLPSHFDAFGNVVLEALASGVPVLVSRKAGAAEVIEPGRTGWIMEDPEDATLVADRILELAANREMREQMGKAACASAEAYSWDGHFAKVLEIYDEVRAEKQRSLAAG
jgi:UDP-glucose:(heptosyl)LPS alpha-1,3-glucosyltransferase